MLIWITSLGLALQAAQVPQAARQLLEQARALLAAKQLAPAADAFLKADALARLNDSDRFTLAMTLAGLERISDSRTQLLRLPDSARKLYWLGRLDFAEQAYAPAIERFREALRLDPGFARAYDGLALCQEASHQYDLAAFNYRQAIEKSQGSLVWPIYNLAALYYRQDNFVESERLLERAIQLQPGFAPALFKLGRIREMQGKEEEAFSLFKSAVDADATMADPHFALARIYRKRADAANAARHMELFLRLRGNSSKPALQDRLR